uniref:Uncharacterized protein n=1 Tax=Triticum urartu TaxID=4572 RepID=A0A8R7V388_TRIUA
HFTTRPLVLHRNRSPTATFSALFWIKGRPSPTSFASIFHPQTINILGHLSL